MRFNRGLLHYVGGMKDTRVRREVIYGKICYPYPGSPDIFIWRSGQSVIYFVHKRRFKISWGCWPHLYSRRLTTRARMFDLYEFLLHAGRSPHLAQGLVRPAILSADWSHDRFTLGWALAACDAKFVDVTFLSNLTAHREARVDTCKTESLCVSLVRATNTRKKERQKIKY